MVKIHRRCFFPIVSSLWLVVGCGGQAIHPLNVGDLAPRFELFDVRTQTSFPSESLEGDVVVLNFWSTSCPVCIKEIEELKEIQEAGRAKVVGIAIDDDPEGVRKVAIAKGVNYPVLSGDSRVFTEYDGFSTPYTLVLDRKFVVRKKYFGPIKKDEFDQLLRNI